MAAPGPGAPPVAPPLPAANAGNFPPGQPVTQDGAGNQYDLSGWTDAHWANAFEGSLATVSAQLVNPGVMPMETIVPGVWSLSSFLIRLAEMAAVWDGILPFSAEHAVICALMTGYSTEWGRGPDADTVDVQILPQHRAAFGVMAPATALQVPKGTFKTVLNTGGLNAQEIDYAAGLVLCARFLRTQLAAPLTVANTIPYPVLQEALQVHFGDESALKSGAERAFARDKQKVEADPTLAGQKFSSVEAAMGRRRKSNALVVQAMSKLGCLS